MQRIFVGDVQGCADELDELLQRARDAFGRSFELWSVGDLVNRGPASRRVLLRVRELAEAGRAHVVLGNHELHLLEVGLGRAALGPSDSFRDVLEASDRDSWLDWLGGLPLVETGTLGERPFAMLHAAAPPGASLALLEADASRVTARLAASRAEARRLLEAGSDADRDFDFLAFVTGCRSIDADGRWSSAEPERPKDAWHARWAARRPDYGVVYGHWARQGLHVAPGLRGLDTGCVHHGRGRDGFLTAWLPDPNDPDPFRVPDRRFWRIPARRGYWPFGRSEA